MNQNSSPLLHTTRPEVRAREAVAGEPLAEYVIARRRAELAEIERRAKAAEEKAQRHYEAEQRLAAEIRSHVAFLAGIGSAEREAPDQIEAAETLMAALR
jgi:hypothetical protein